MEYLLFLKWKDSSSSSLKRGYCPVSILNARLYLQHAVKQRPQRRRDCGSLVSHKFTINSHHRRMTANASLFGTAAEICVKGVCNGAAEALSSERNAGKMLHRHISCSAVWTMGHLEVPRQAQSSTQPTQDDTQKNQEQPAERRGVLWREWKKDTTLLKSNDYNVCFVHIYAITPQPKNIYNIIM